MIALPGAGMASKGTAMLDWALSAEGVRRR